LEDEDAAKLFKILEDSERIGELTCDVSRVSHELKTSEKLVESTQEQVQQLNKRVEDLETKLIQLNSELSTTKTELEESARLRGGYAADVLRCFSCKRRLGRLVEGSLLCSCSLIIKVYAIYYSLTCSVGEVGVTGRS
jgi:predicted RNase H-like nuclease (RuvC/YqgF family)